MKTRIGLSFSASDLDRISQLQVALGTRNRTETISVAVQLALALKTDPIGSLAAARVHFESAITIEFKDGKVLVKAPSDPDQEETMTSPAEWTATKDWLRQHPDATPGGIDGQGNYVPDLFDAPLPIQPTEGEEWTGSVEWGEQGDPPGVRWNLPGTGYAIIMPGVGEPTVIDDEGFYV